MAPARATAARATSSSSGFCRSRASWPAATSRPASPTTIWSRSPASAWSRRSSASTPTADSRSRSFAVPTIVGELKRYFRDTGWALHVDRSAQERARKITDAQQQITARDRPRADRQRAGRSTSRCSPGGGPRRASDRRGVRRDLARRAACQSDDEGPSTGSTPSATRTSGSDMVDEQATIFAAARHLPERERQILFLRFSEDLTQTEIADRVGVSQMQVSRLLRRSLQRLRDLT